MYKKRVLKTYVKIIDTPTPDPIRIFSTYVPDKRGLFLEINGGPTPSEEKANPPHGHVIICRLGSHALQLQNNETTLLSEGNITKTNGRYLNTLRLIMDKVELVDDHNLPFAGGVIGTIGYEIAKQYEKINDDNPDDLNLPDAHLLLVEAFISIDTSTNQVKIVVLENPDASGEKRALEKLRDMATILQTNAEPGHTVQSIESIENANKALPKKTVATSGGQALCADAVLYSNIGKDGFMENVIKGKDYIMAGDIFQVVLSQRLKIPLTQDPFEVFQTLRKINPSPYMYYMDFGDYQVIGSSPELLVKYHGDRIETCPIAGAIKRGQDEEEDEQRAQALLNDEKELAEHAMLVDLARNDIGRFSKVGTVTLSKFLDVQKFSHIQHLVSTVEGIKDEDVHPLDILAGFIPAGTLSGAPKIRAMEIIEELENTHRGIYGGAIGYFDYKNHLDTCIAIRTMVVKDGIGYIQAGAGIVADSVPEKEYEESMSKAQALISALKGGQ